MRMSNQGDGYIVLNPWESTTRVWSSRDFAWKVLKHKQPHEMPKHSTACTTLLWNLIRACCPGYNELCGRRWSVHTLMVDAGHVADVAFLCALDLAGEHLFKLFSFGLID